MNYQLYSIQILAFMACLPMFACTQEPFPAPPPHIAAINGDGTPDGEDGHADNHVQNSLVITGQNLQGGQVSLSDPAGDSVALTVESDSDTRLDVALPDNIEAGNHTVRVTTKGGEDQEDVMLLQGERGPQGEPGPPGPVALYEVDTVIQVTTGDCADLLAAIRGLDSFAIGGNATVTIDVSGGPYACAESLVFDHPDGARLKLVGDTSGDATTISFADVSGVVVASGHALGGFDGFVLAGTGTSESPEGVRANAGSYVHVGPNLRVESFASRCYFAVMGATLIANGTIGSQCGGNGYSAHFDAFIRADYAQSLEMGSHGFVAHNGSTIQARDSTATGNGQFDYYAERLSLINAPGASGGTFSPPPDELSLSDGALIRD